MDALPQTFDGGVKSFDFGAKTFDWGAQSRFFKIENNNFIV